MDIKSIEGTLFDSGGNAIEVPENHVVCSAKDSFCLVKLQNPDYSFKFVYRPDNVNQKKHKDFCENMWQIE